MSYKNHWFVRDHLGSVRAVVDITSYSTSLQDIVIEQNDYLPFGTRSYNGYTPQFDSKDDQKSNKMIKSIFSIFFISIIAYGFTSCADSMEDTFRQFTHVPFFEYKNYSVWDRESSTYFIDYESVRYMAVMPVGSDELISIVRLEPEPVDSTRVYPVYDISELIKKDICNICLIFRSVWWKDYKQIYLQNLRVINRDYAILKIFWKKTECVYYVYIRNQSSDNLSEWNRITLESHMNKIGNDIWYSTHQVYPNQ